MDDNKEKIVSVPYESAATDSEQIPCKDTGILTNTAQEDNDEISLIPGKGLSLNIVSLDNILDSYYEPKEPIIDNLLLPGTCILAGASKIGKSFLVAEMAFCIATGKNLWDEKYRCTKGTVLYLALEDDLQRIQTRFSKMFGTEGSSSLHFAIASKSIDEGLMMQLTEYVNAYPDVKLIIIDTLQKIRGLSNENISYSRDYDVITQLKNLSDKYGICILLVHHTRKQDADDAFDKISGTNGLMGSADSAIIMTRKRGSTEAKLQITGRDQQEQIINIVQNLQTLQWEYVDSETTLWEEPHDEIIEKISSFLASTAAWSGTATELIEEAGLGNIATNVLSRKLKAKASLLWTKYGIKVGFDRKSYVKTITLIKR